MSDDMSTSADRPTLPVLPYAVPAALDRRGVWREGDLIVKPDGTSLPSRCVRCNDLAADAIRAALPHYPSFRLSSGFRNLRVPLCAAHLSLWKRKRRALSLLQNVAWVAFVAMLFLLTDKLAPPLLFGLLASAIALIWIGGLLKHRAQPLRLKRVAEGNL